MNRRSFLKRLVGFTGGLVAAPFAVKAAKDVTFTPTLLAADGRRPRSNAPTIGDIYERNLKARNVADYERLEKLRSEELKRDLEQTVWNITPKDTPFAVQVYESDFGTIVTRKPHV